MAETMRSFEPSSRIPLCSARSDIAIRGSLLSARVRSGEEVGKGGKGERELKRGRADGRKIWDKKGAQAILFLHFKHWSKSLQRTKLVWDTQLKPPHVTMICNIA